MDSALAAGTPVPTIGPSDDDPVACAGFSSFPWRAEPPVQATLNARHAQGCTVKPRWTKSGLAAGEFSQRTKASAPGCAPFSAATG